jgi:hypothetical protein
MEDVFYSGRFDLPYHNILGLFRQGVAEDKNDPTYDTVMVGIAPGGTVAVWVTGKQSTVEVFFGRAEKADINWTKAIDYPEAKRASFVKAEIEESVKPDTLADIRKNGIPFEQWAHYRTKYQWAPAFIGSGEPKDVGIVYYNGEANKHIPIKDNNLNEGAKPIPKAFYFHSQILGQTKKSLYVINFDEEELLSAFAKLGSHQEQLRLEFSPTLPKPDTKIRLYNDKESIQLTKWKVDVW